MTEYRSSIQMQLDEMARQQVEGPDGLILEGERRTKPIEERAAMTVEEDNIEHEQDIIVADTPMDKSAPDEVLPPVATDQDKVQEAFQGVMGKIKRYAKRRRENKANGMIETIDYLKNGVHEIMRLQTATIERVVALEQMRDLRTIPAVQTNSEVEHNEEASSSPQYNVQDVRAYKRQEYEREHKTAPDVQAYHDMPPLHETAGAPGGGYLIPNRMAPPDLGGPGRRANSNGVISPFPPIPLTGRFEW